MGVELKKGILVLAAGYSRRFGGSKLSAILDNGSTVLQQTLQRISAATDNILIVTRQDLLDEGLLDTGLCHAESLRHYTQREQPSGSRMRIALCEDSHLGMAHTLAFGIRQIQDWDACLLCLGDMPFVTTASYQQLLAALRTDNIVVPEYNEQTGNPAGFGKRFFDALMQLQGDSGGRAVIRAHAQHVHRVPVMDSAVLQDIDTPGDLRRLQ